MKERLIGSGIIVGVLVSIDRIVRRHSGRVWADATVGRGATFHFTLAAAATLRDQAA